MNKKNDGKYDIMLIDDEAAILEHLRSLIEWEKLPLNLVACAQDSETARELYLSHRPNIIITDIKIPIINGLELAKELTALDPNLRVIVITGFSDIDYVKDAVNLGAISFLTKPIQTEEVNNSLRRAVEYFRDLREKEYAQLQAKNLLAESLPVMQQRFIHQLLYNSDFYGEARARKKCAEFELEGIFVGEYVVATLKPDFAEQRDSEDVGKGEREKGGEQLDLMLFAIKNMLDELLAKAGCPAFSTYNYGSGRLYAIVGLDEETDFEPLDQVFENLQRHFKFFFNVNVLVGVSDTQRELMQLYRAREQSERALVFSDSRRDMDLIYYRTIGHPASPESVETEKIQDLLYEYFMSEKYEEKEMTELVESAITVVSSRAGEQFADPLTAARKFCLQFVTTLVHALFKLDIMEEWLDDYVKFIGLIHSVDTMAKLSRYTNDLIRTLADVLHISRDGSGNYLIEQAKQYIKNNYNKTSLGLDEVSRAINISSIYLCKLFSRHTDSSFTEYVNRVRINEAKRLLRETDLRIQEISDRVGYAQAKYFNYVFKRLEQVTPTAYRRMGKTDVKI